MSRFNTWLRQKLAPLSFVVGHLDISVGRYEEEESYIQALNLYFVRLACIAIFLVLIVFAPGDFWYLKDNPPLLKLMLLCRLVFGTMIIYFWRWTLRHPISYYRIQHWIVMGAFWIFAGALCVSRFGPFTEPWYFIGILIPLGSMLIITDLKTRAAGTLLIIVSGFLGTFISDPYYFVGNFVGIYGAYISFSALMSIVFGELYSQNVRENHRSSLALKAYNASLSDLVEEKTREATTAMLDAEIVQEQTRLELSRELHDELGHLIAVHNIGIHQLLVDYTKDSEQADWAGTFIEELLDIEKGARKTIIELRGNLKLEEPIILSLMEWLHAFGLQSGVRTEPLVEPEDLNLDGRLAFVIARVIQEAMENVRQHAEATKAEVCIFQEEEGIRVSIRDNGKGFVPDETKMGSGLLGIQERVKSLNGEFRLDDRHSAGIELIVTIPDMTLTKERSSA